MMADRTCDNCRFALMDDYGYSNYTVEGTDFTCLKGLHPAGTFDRFYGEDERFRYAAHCAGYSKGDHVWIDCDRERQVNYGDPYSATYTSDPEVAALLDKWQDNRGLRNG